MRLLICAGMTGGGIYPALAVHQALKDKIDATLWVGSETGLEEEILAPFNIPFSSIPGGGVHGMEIARLPKNILQLMRGYKKAKSIVQDFKPDVIFYTGGYIGVPMAQAARGVPSVVFVPDVEPSLALQLIMRNASRIAVSTDRSLKYVKNARRVRATGYPIRKELKRWTRESGRQFFDIGGDEKVLLVFGGSKGARSLNDALIPHVNSLAKEMHVIHITGTANWEDCQAQLAADKLANPNRYHPYPFLHEEIGAAFAAADLVVCRAGASTIGELPYFSLPAILVPYPHAWRYQYQNADYLVAHGGAVLLKDEDLNNQLAAQVLGLIHNQAQLNQMQRAMHTLAVQDAASQIAKIIEEVGSKGTGGSKA